MLETLVGSVGFMVLLSAFLLNLIGRMSRQGVLYGALNMSGAAALAWYALMKDAPVFVALETVWAVTAAITLVSLAWRRSRLEAGP